MYEAPATQIASIAEVADATVELPTALGNVDSTAELDQPVADVILSTELAEMADSLPEYEDLLGATPMRVDGLGSSEPVVELAE